jgi:DNA repair protein RecN (Recombination protein N)
MGEKADMIVQLSVRQLAVVEDIELELEPGMTSLTGETGAGKSLVVDALGLVLGDRADSKMVRYGSERAEVSASFDISSNPELQQWLIENELDEDGECNLRRTISKEGRSRAYINGRNVTLSQLRCVSEYTIDIHGQHAHQSLIRSETQREILDIAANNKALLKHLKAAYKQWFSSKQQLEALKQHNHDQSAHLELLQYQVAELEKYELTEAYIEQLLKEQNRLSHVSQFLSVAESASHQLFDQDIGDVYSTITKFINELEPATEVEPLLAAVSASLNTTLIHLDEANTDLRNYIDSADVDPERLHEVETTVSSLHDLARKHQIEIEQLPAHFQALCDELGQISQNTDSEAAVAQRLANEQKECLELCQKISERRRAAAPLLAAEITKSIQQLAMPAGQIDIRVDQKDKKIFSETGYDNIQLLVKTNPGQDLDELGKVASGGELARISLAIQVATAGSRTVPTLVFDEVDVGIGGGVAEIVGKHLRDLAAQRQVICITHLPQVASQAHQQLQVIKTQSSNSTHIEISRLTPQQRIEEIARMLGGVNLTEKTCLHAEEMLMQAQDR